MTEKKSTPQPGKRVTHEYHSPEKWAAARVLYESTPGITYDQIAAQVGIPAGTISKRASTESWKKKSSQPDMNEAAQALADRFAGKLADYGIVDPADAPRDVAEQAKQELIEETSVKLRAELIDRHRREWGAIRTLVYKHLNPNAPLTDAQRFEKAKLAKISAETLQIIQGNERKAWGLDKPPEGNTTIVIERG